MSCLWENLCLHYVELTEKRLSNYAIMWKIENGADMLTEKPLFIMQENTVFLEPVDV